MILTLNCLYHTRSGILTEIVIPNDVYLHLHQRRNVLIFSAVNEYKIGNLISGHRVGFINDHSTTKHTGTTRLTSPAARVHISRYSTHADLKRQVLFLLYSSCFAVS
jgi:hypothetical protein